jgi:hypothetical protein
MYQVLELGADESQSYRQLLEIQNPEKKWHDYFSSFGMKGEVLTSDVK